MRSRPFANSAVLACLLAGASCGKSSPTSGAGGTGAGGNDGCAQNALKILFNPMYSAFDGVHTFQLPAIVNGLDTKTVNVTWKSSDPLMVAFAPDPATGGVMMTMQKAGTATIYAQAGNLCGAAPLTITAATADDWMAGSKRYNDGVVLAPGPGGGADGGMVQQAACTNCHGDTANGAFKDVAHTPTQTGGFSDDELIDIFAHGVVPTDGYFDNSIVPYALWQMFHQWDVGESGKGVVVYLRSLTPSLQKGAFNIDAFLDAGVPEVGVSGPDGGAPDTEVAGSDGGLQADAGGF